MTFIDILVKPYYFVYYVFNKYKKILIKRLIISYTYYMDLSD